MSKQEFEKLGMVLSMCGMTLRADETLMEAIRDTHSIMKPENLIHILDSMRRVEKTLHDTIEEYGLKVVIN